jgi:hypothetical protein
MVNAFASEQRPVTADMITQVAADFRLISPAMPEEVPLSVTQREENGASMLRNFFRLLKTMDNQELEGDKPMQTTAARRI